MPGTADKHLGHLAALFPQLDPYRLELGFELVVLDVEAGIRIAHSGVVPVGKPATLEWPDWMRSYGAEASAVEIRKVTVEGVASNDLMRSRGQLAHSRAVFRQVAAVVTTRGNATSTVEVSELLGVEHSGGGREAQRAETDRQRRIVGRAVTGAPHGAVNARASQALAAHGIYHSTQHVRRLVSEARKAGYAPPAKTRGRPGR